MISRAQTFINQILIVHNNINITHYECEKWKCFKNITEQTAVGINVFCGISYNYTINHNLFEIKRKWVIVHVCY